MDAKLEPIIIYISLVFAWNLFSGNLGPFSLLFYRYLGLLLFIVMLLAILPKLYKRHLSNFVGICIISIGLIGILIFPEKEYWLLGFSICISGLGLCLESSLVIFAFSIAVSLYTVLILLIQFNPNFYYLLSLACIESSSKITDLFGQPNHFGSYISGFWILMTFISLITSLFLFSKNKLEEANRLMIGISGLALCYLIYLVMLSYLKDGVYLSHSNCILLLLCSLILIYYLIDRDFKLIELKSYKNKYLIIPMALILIITIAFIALISISYAYVPTPMKGNVVFYDCNDSMHWNSVVIPKENATLGNKKSYLNLSESTSFGAYGLPLLLNNSGYNVTLFRNNKPLEETLQGANILVIGNLIKPFSYNDLTAIWNFAFRGGSVLVFCEHTSSFVDESDFLIGRDYLNELLEPTGIRVNPDTADWLKGSWMRPLVIFPHPITYKVKENELYINSVGASLKLKGTASPIIMAPWGFSDAANLSSSGHLGNRRYESGEQIGDIVIAAADQYGKGKFLVFGDTSYLFEVGIPTEHTLLKNIFRWLSNDSTIHLPYTSWASIILSLIALSSFLCLILYGDLRLIIICPALIALSLALAVIITDLQPTFDPPTDEAFAYIDGSHNNLVCLKGAQDDSANGLISNLFREGYIPKVIDDTSEIKVANVRDYILIIIAPTKIFDINEINYIRNFVYNGGTLLLSAGYNERDAVKDILNIFGLDILNIPLGSYPWKSGSELRELWHDPKFMDAYPIRSKGDYESYFSIYNKKEKYDLIVRKSYGKGNIILIGDSRFLLDENLERIAVSPEQFSSYEYRWLGNLELFHDILNKCRKS